MDIHVGRDGQLIGVFPHASIASQIETGQVLLTDLAWVAGETDWLTLKDFARKHGIPLIVAQPERSHQDRACDTPPFRESDDAVGEIAQPRPSFSPGTLIVRSCPRCESKSVKKISLIISEGTTDHETTSSVSGSGFVGSSVVHVSGRRTESGTSQTRLAAMLSEELQIDEASNPLGMVGLLSLIAAGVAGYLVGHYFHSGAVGVGTGIAVFCACVLGYTSIKPSKETMEKSEQLNRWQEHGHYCHQCAHRFIPGSAEAYPYSSGDADSSWS